MPQPLIVISRRSLVAGVLLFAALVALAASVGTARADAASASQEPRIVAVEGFAFEPNQGKGLRVAALVLSQYPEVEARDYPKPLRKHLRFRAHARLDVFDGGTRIARGREAGSLPVAAKRHSLRFVHLILFSRTESAAILAAGDPEAAPARALRSDGDEAVDTTALSALEVIARGKTLERSHAEEDALVGLSDQTPPRVIRGCVIAPGTRCPGADLSGADLSHADLSGADLNHADLGDANLFVADLHDADLSGADTRGADMRGAKLRGANLSGADFYDVDLSWADFTSANISRANLSRARLFDAVLRFADLSDAKLSGAYLSGYIGATFYGANLTRADLRGANVARTEFTSAKFNETRCPNGERVSSPATC